MCFAYAIIIYGRCRRAITVRKKRGIKQDDSYINKNSKNHTYIVIINLSVYCAIYTAVDIEKYITIYN